MPAALLASAADEGRDVVLSMLVVGLLFLAIILIGDLWTWRAHKRRERSRY
jgi:hypothetical protein